MHISLDAFGTFAAMWMLEDRLGEVKRERLFISWVALCAAVNVALPGSYMVPVVELLHVGTAALFFVSFVIAFKKPKSRSKWVTLATVVGFLACVSDLLVQVGVVETLSIPRLTPFAFFTLLFTSSVSLFGQFLDTFRAAQRSNEDLARVVKKKEEELSRQHERLRELEAERAAAQERSRLMRELHDGMGGHLVLRPRVE